MGITKNLETMDNSEKLKRAKKRVEEIRGFYTHLAVYLVINTFIILMNLIYGHHKGFSWGWWGFLVTPLFWGVGLAFHAMSAFQWNPFFGRTWERKMIEKYMDEDRREAGNYMDQP